MKHGWTPTLVGMLALAVTAGCGGDSGTTTKPDPVVSISPSDGAVDVTESIQLDAQSTRSPSARFHWSIQEGEGHGSISEDGLYTAPAIRPDPPIATIVAVDAERPEDRGEVTVRLVDLTPAGFVRVPAGSFTMGDVHPESYCWSGTYPVTLTSDFYLGQTEITNQEFVDVLNWAYARGRITFEGKRLADAVEAPGDHLFPTQVSHPEFQFDGEKFVLVDGGLGLNPDHPVKQVTFYGAAAYCNWRSEMEGLKPAYDLATWACNGDAPYRARGYRLPTNAEWQYAAQFPDGRTYPWGEAPPTSALANYGFAVGWTSAAKSYPPEKYFGDRGIYDLASNVSEWSNDRGQCESIPPEINPVGAPEYSSRVRCGGSWQSVEALMRASARGISSPGTYTPWIGFRVARTVHP